MLIVDLSRHVEEHATFFALARCYAFSQFGVDSPVEEGTND